MAIKSVVASEALLNKLLSSKKVQPKTDAALAVALETFPATISKIRAQQIPLSANLLITIQDEFGLSLKQIRSLASA